MTKSKVCILAWMLQKWWCALFSKSYQDPLSFQYKLMPLVMGQRSPLNVYISVVCGDSYNIQSQVLSPPPSPLTSGVLWRHPRGLPSLNPTVLYVAFSHAPTIFLVYTKHLFKTICLRWDDLLLKGRMHVLLIFVVSTLLWTYSLYQELGEKWFSCIMKTKTKKRNPLSKCQTVCWVLSLVILFNTHNDPMKWVLRLRLSNLPKVTKPVRDKVMVLT